jgi:hypothetical protein
VRAQLGADALGEHRSPSQRDHRLGRGALQELAHEPLLAGAEGLFAVQLELACERMPEALGQQRIAVEGFASQRARELAGGGRLAGAHEADQDECHPMRCA